MIIQMPKKKVSQPATPATETLLELSPLELLKLVDSLEDSSNCDLQLTESPALAM